MSESTIFSQRVMPHSRRMFAVAYRYLQSTQEAEDILQDAMLKLWQIREKLPPNEQLLPFLLTVIKNLSIDRLRARQAIEDNYDIGDIDSIGFSEAPLDNDSSFEDKERLRQMLNLINQLPSDQQKVLRLKAFDDLTTEEIANKLQLQPDNVRQLLSRARKRLRELAQKQELL